MTLYVVLREEDEFYVKPYGSNHYGDQSDAKLKTDIKGNRSFVIV